MKYSSGRPNTYGEIEQLAGVTDREAFWRGKTEDQAKRELRGMIRQRVARGEMSLCYRTPDDEPVVIEKKRRKDYIGRLRASARVMKGFEQMARGYC